MRLGEGRGEEGGVRRSRDESAWERTHCPPSPSPRPAAPLPRSRRPPHRHPSSRPRRPPRNPRAGLHPSCPLLLPPHWRPHSLPPPRPAGSRAHHPARRLNRGRRRYSCRTLPGGDQASVSWRGGGGKAAARTIVILHGHDGQMSEGDEEGGKGLSARGGPSRGP